MEEKDIYGNWNEGENRKTKNLRDLVKEPNKTIETFNEEINEKNKKLNEQLVEAYKKGLTKKDAAKALELTIGQLDVLLEGAGIVLCEGPLRSDDEGREQ